jgi:hypothetical protein
MSAIVIHERHSSLETRYWNLSSNNNREYDENRGYMFIFLLWHHLNIDIACTCIQKNIVPKETQTR